MFLQETKIKWQEKSHKQPSKQMLKRFLSHNLQVWRKVDQEILVVVKIWKK